MGLGATGSHAARQLRADDVSLSITDTSSERFRIVLDALEGSATRAEPRGEGAAVVILATPRRGHAATAERLVRGGASVVSLTDDHRTAERLIGLDQLARDHGATVLVGAGFAPGYSCLLARHAARSIDRVDAVFVAKAGTAGPACARQHHWALRRTSTEWFDGAWTERRGGSGRDLAWFPDPFGAHDCYRAELPSPLLLRPAFPEASRIAARMSANRRDRVTMRLPMLRRPHADGGPGAVRVEVRGLGPNGYETQILGAIHYPSAASGITGAVAALEILDGSVAPGAGGLAVMADDPGRWLLRCAERGLSAAQFEGSS